jgi:hypothetical protein
MPIIATASGGGGTFTPHPEGSYGAVCADVYDLGMVEVTWQGKTQKRHKIEVYFFCDEWTEFDGRKVPMLVRDRFTLSLAETSRLRPFLEAWRGKKFTDAELAGFDVESLIGAPAFVQVTHNQVGDKTYANIDAALRLPKGMTAPSIPADFKRRHLRDAEKAADTTTQAQKPWEDDSEDDLPFS